MSGAAASTWSRSRDTMVRGQKPVFYALTLAFLGFLILAMNEPMRFVYMAWLPEYIEPMHRVHHVTIGAMITVLALSVVAQLYRPHRQIGAMLLSVTLVGTLGLAALVGNGIAGFTEMIPFVVPVAIIAMLHPALWNIPAEVAHVDRRMLAVALLAAIPLVVFAGFQLYLHLTLSDGHVAFGHYLMMATVASTVAIGAILASARPGGWRVLLYGVCALAIIVGAASVAFPDPAQGANLGVIGGVALAVWALVFAGLGELRDRRLAG